MTSAAVDLLPDPLPAGARVPPNLRWALLSLPLLAFVALVAALALHPVQRLSEQLWFLLVVLLGEGLAVLLAFRLARWPLRRAFSGFGFSVATLRALLRIGLGNLLLVGGLLYLLTLVFGPLDGAFLDDLFEVRNGVEFLLLAVTVGVAAPLMEELMIRGVLLRGLATSWGAVGGVLWSALFFAVIHLNPLQAAPAFVNGAVWGLVLLRTGSLGATFFLHALNNSLVFLFVHMGSALESRAAGGAGAAATEPSLAGGVMAALMALAGGSLVMGALRVLPRSPERLARLWALPAGPPAGEVVAIGQRPLDPPDDGGPGGPAVPGEVLSGDASTPVSGGTAAECSAAIRHPPPPLR
ncbi:MAG: CPBP family intramembrane metalloprotease [Gemmatimonadetes bacterium]|nr:CPBP family intramembrane metalloprotease [Gemmatimonadota bacterium]